MRIIEFLKNIFKGKKQEERVVRRAYYSGVNFGDESQGVIHDSADILVFKNNQFVTASIVDLAKIKHISDDKTLFNTIDKSEFLHIKFKLSDGDKIDVDVNAIFYDPTSQEIKGDIYISAKDVEITSFGDVIVDNSKTKTIVEYR